MSVAETLQKNLTSIHQNIAAACNRSGRNPSSLRIVIVTKYAEWEWVQELHAGLLLLSGAQAGPVGQALLQGDTQRATDVALECAHLPAAWQAASRWRQLDPENVDALRAAGLVALELWRIDDARALFREMLGKPDVEPDRALGELLPLVTDGLMSASHP